mgnify:CR=1 FL=1
MDEGFALDVAWEHITRHVAGDLGLSIGEAPSWFGRFLRLTGKVFSLNCNNCMLRSKTFSRMRAMADDGAPLVMPARRVESSLMLGMPGDSLFPLWYSAGLNRQEYPPLYEPLGNTSFRNREAHRDGEPGRFFVEVDDVEGTDVHSQYDIDFIEFHLQRHPDHFGFE